MRVAINEHDALVVVDVQNDFCPGGALAVPDGDKVVPALNEYVTKFHRAGRPIASTRDWHPPDHVSFEAHGGRWPPHCIKDSDGAAYHPDLELPRETHHVQKGTEADQEAYSAFLGTDLAAWLGRHGTERVFVGGLATDYCVKETVLDALDEGFTTFLLEDATRGVNVEPDDVEKAKAEMMRRGAIVIEFEDLLRG